MFTDCVRPRRLQRVCAAAAAFALGASAGLAATFSISGEGQFAGSSVSGFVTIDDSLLVPNQSFYGLAGFEELAMTVTFGGGAPEYTLGLDNVDRLGLSTDVNGFVTDFSIVSASRGNFRVQGVEPGAFRGSDPANTEFFTVSLERQTTVVVPPVAFSITGAGEFPGSEVSGRVVIDGALLTPNRVYSSSVNGFEDLDMTITFGGGAPVYALGLDNVDAFILLTDANSAVTDFNIQFATQGALSVQAVAVDSFQASDPGNLEVFNVALAPEATVVPLPASGLMLMGGIALAGVAARRRTGAATRAPAAG